MGKYIDKEKLLKTIDKRRKDAWHNPILQEMLEYAYSIVEACDEDVQTEENRNSRDEQTPRKPLKIEKGSWEYEAFGGEFYACSRCAEMLNGEHWNFCPYCGQALDWSDEENE